MESPTGRPELDAQKNYRTHRQQLDAMASLEARFAYIVAHNLWGSEQSRSGPGATLEETATLRHQLPTVLATVGASSILDIPCGDCRWMSEIDLGAVSYVGADILDAVVARNRQLHSAKGRFLRLDLTADDLPRADVVLCRDCLVHLSFANIAKAIENVKRSGARWLLTTHFVRLEANRDIADGDWRPLNFVEPPFSWPAPHLVLIENCMEGGGAYDDKSLALWPVQDLP